MKNYRLICLSAGVGSKCLQRKEKVLQDMTHLLEQLGHEDAHHFVRIMERIHQFTPPGMDEPDKDETDKEGSADEQ